MATRPAALHLEGVPLPATRAAVRWPVCAVGALSLALVSTALVRAPELHGDSGEYLLTVQALVNHGTPDLRAPDVGAFAGRATRSDVQGAFGGLSRALRRTTDGRLFAYHFFAYPLAVVPAWLAFDALGIDVLKAPAFTNALLLSAAALFALLAPWSHPRVAAASSLLLLLGPAAWYVPWPHPEVFCFALVAASITCATGGHVAAATALSALASMQNPPIAALAAGLALATWRRAGVRRAAAAFAPALLPPLFYVVTFGRPSLMWGESASLEAITLAKAASLLLDPDIGLLPYMPGVVVLALVALLVPRPGVVACWCAFLALALGASSGFLWNPGMSGPARYAVWCSPLVVAAAAQLARGRLGATAVGVALCVQVGVLAAALPSWGEEDRQRHTRLATWVMTHHAAWWSPHPDVFRGRTPALAPGGPHVEIVDGRCVKALAQKRHLTVLAETCGAVPPSFVEWTRDRVRLRDREAWRYVDF